MAQAYQPKVRFMVIGAQKCGTSALREYLRRHPQIGLTLQDEVHLFDGADYSPAWSPKEFDQRYENAFRHCQGADILGEVTPIYLFLPEVAAALKQYNPSLKLIVLLRDRTQRAISHYYMERNRGNERAPLWWALLAEPMRIRGCMEPRRPDSAMRVHSYRRRGLYSFQLGNLYRHFGRGQVHIIRTLDLLHNHSETLRRVFSFLGVAEDIDLEPLIANEGSYHPQRHPFVSRLLQLSYLPEQRRAKALGLPC